MPRPPVTSDHDVLCALVNSKGKKRKPTKSTEVAKLIGLTVYQITARLKGMEGRGLLCRPKPNLWQATNLGVDTRLNPPKQKPKRKTTDGKPVAPTKPSDDDVPHIKSMKKSEGWDWRNGWTDKGLKGIEIFISPKGVEYVEAHPFEKADLIREFPEHPGVNPMRLVKWENSVSFRHHEKKVAKEEDEKEGREEAAIEKRRRKTAKKAGKKKTTPRKRSKKSARTRKRT